MRPGWTRTTGPQWAQMGEGAVGLHGRLVLIGKRIRGRNWPTCRDALRCAMMQREGERVWSMHSRGARLYWDGRCSASAGGGSQCRRDTANRRTSLPIGRCSRRRNGLPDNTETRIDYSARSTSSSMDLDSRCRPIRGTLARTRTRRSFRRTERSSGRRRCTRRRGTGPCTLR